MSHYVYIVECSDGTLYTGYTTNISRRIQEHNAGNGAKYTQGRQPVELVYSESHDTRSTALSREYEIKQLPRSEKDKLVDCGSTGTTENFPENE
ncbi:MAG: GIY-YIG nuclease family protein [Halobacteriaceae archaeon]